MGGSEELGNDMAGFAACVGGGIIVCADSVNLLDRWLHDFLYI